MSSLRRAELPLHHSNFSVCAAKASTRIDFLLLVVVKKKKKFEEHYSSAFPAPLTLEQADLT